MKFVSGLGLCLAAAMMAVPATGKDYFVSMAWTKAGDVCDGSQEDWVFINAEPFVFSVPDGTADGPYFVAYQWAFMDYVEREYPQVLRSFKNHTHADNASWSHEHTRAAWQEKVLKGGFYDLHEQCGKTVPIPLDGFVPPKRFDGTWISEARKQELLDYFTWDPYR